MIRSQLDDVIAVQQDLHCIATGIEPAADADLGLVAHNARAAVGLDLEAIGRHDTEAVSRGPDATPATAVIPDDFDPIAAAQNIGGVVLGTRPTAHVHAVRIDERRVRLVAARERGIRDGYRQRKRQRHESPRRIACASVGHGIREISRSLTRRRTVRRASITPLDHRLRTLRR